MPHRIIIFLLTITALFISTLSTSISFAGSARYGYDELDRLRWVQYEDGTVISYEYDKAGNRTEKRTYMGSGTSFPITAAVTGYGTITPSGTASIPQGYNQTYYIEGGSASDGGNCPTGYTFTTARNRCEKSQVECPTGYTYKGGTDRCEKAVTSNYQASLCPDGYSVFERGWMDTDVCYRSFLLETYPAIYTGSSCDDGYYWDSDGCYFEVDDSGPFPMTPHYICGAPPQFLIPSIPYEILESYYGGFLYSQGVCQPTYDVKIYEGAFCRPGDTKSGTTCTATTINTASAICTNGMLDPTREVCYAYKGGTLSNLYVDGVDVFSTLSSMPGPTGPIYYYTFANVSSSHTIAANFSANGNTPCSNFPARLNRATPVNHLSLQAAYDSAITGDTIQVNMTDHIGGFRLDRNVSIHLDSGYSCDYSAKTGAITISGGMNIFKGAVSIKGSVVLK